MKAGARTQPGTRRHFETVLMLAVTIFFTACDTTVQNPNEAPVAATSLDALAEQYVKIALALRAYDGNYVDAYYGPESWSDEAEARGASLDELIRETDGALEQITSIDDARQPAIVQARRDGLEKRLRSMRLRMAMAEGERRSFDEESRLLFDAVAPEVDLNGYRAVLMDIAALVPGEGELADRVKEFRERFQISSDRVSGVFDAAIAECRRRTLEHIDLPESESFVLEYVTDKPWSGYNWYQGRAHSLIQINIDLPIFIDRAIDLGCHEGYPGHHTYSVLTETELVKSRGWVEFSLTPLFGPMSLISEGSANYGIELAFTDAERREFERDVLAPLAHLSTEELDAYQDLRDALHELRNAEIAIARDYLDGRQSTEETISRMREFSLLSRERALQRLRFLDAYRSYAINYGFGRDLIAQYVEREAGDDRETRWRVFEELLSRPASPSDLR